MTDEKVIEITRPQISVIMGIYNCADTLPESIESIINQTFKDWELILCDDGSSDNTYQVARQYKAKYPEKIVLLRNKKNRGLNYTLNRCLRAAKGEFIARMDGDDRCPVNRFTKELEVLRRESDIAIVSTDMGFFDETGVWGNISHPEYPSPTDFLHGTPFCHAPCMVRKTAYDKVGGYSESDRLLRVEDYHLWIKMYSAGFKGKNIHETLYYMRDDRNAYSRRRFKYRLNEAYVKAFAVRELKLPLWGYFYAFRPIVVGLLPPKLYDCFHKRNLNE
ncbi:MAG: glycosyltransferase [Lachnospiraceae bacterium]|nr:glycosyltransferase [Lachnospiraceae bacterium]